MLSLKKAVDMFMQMKDLEAITGVVFVGEHTTMEYAIYGGWSVEMSHQRSS